MNHNDALQQMAVERYLLDELEPADREAFEEHMFDCQECAIDLRAASVFVEEAKAQLPVMTEAPSGQRAAVERPRERKQWFSWMSPAFAMPAFAALLIVIGYQNFAMIPGLREAANRPEVLPWAQVHIATRDGGPAVVNAERGSSVMLFVDLPQQDTYSSYVFELQDSQGRNVWKSKVVTPDASQGGTVSLRVPAELVRHGANVLASYGVEQGGGLKLIGSRGFDVHFVN